MAVYRINYYLYRSNPMIWRDIMIPSECTVQDLIAAFCLAMGISPAPGKIWDEEEQVISEKTVLKNIFETDDFLRLTTGRCEIVQAQKRQELNSLTFFYEVVDKLDENLQAPKVLDGTLFHIPQNVFRVGVINEILNGLERQESYTVNAIGTFYRGQQDYNRKKTQNLLYSWFLPEKATMLRTEFSVPLPTVLENTTVNELKSLAEQHHVYVYNHRKADYVAALNNRLCEIDPYSVLKQMSILEYQSFRELVLNGEIASRNIYDLYKIFPILFHYGMISFSKKQGVFLASAIMQEYEDWYDQEKEIQFRKEKIFASVMIGCRSYYGVFTKKICKNVLDTLYPGEISEEMLDQMWGTRLDGAVLSDIAFKQYTETKLLIAEKEFLTADSESCNAETESLIAYDQTLFNPKEELLYLKVLSEDDTPRFIPDKEAFESAIRNGIGSDLQAYNDLILFLQSYAYDGYDRQKLCRDAINCLRKGYPAAESSNLVVQRLHYVWSGREVVQKKLEYILGKMLPDLPLILLYGFTANIAMEQNIMPKAQTELNRLMIAIEEEEKARKKAEAARKAAARKAATRKPAARKSGTTGKRGRWS